MRARVPMLAIWLAGGLLRAEPPAVAVELLDDAIPTASPPARHVFGGGPVNVRLALDAPIGTELKLKGDLVQVAGTLSVTLNADLPLGDAVSFSDRTHLLVGKTIELPEVKRITRMIARIQAGDASGICRAAFVVYPKDLLKPFKTELDALAARGKGGLAVFGESPRIRKFLKAAGIPFEYAGTAWPQAPRADRVYLGEETAEHLSRAESKPGGGRFVIFVPDPALPDGVYFPAAESPGLCKVTLPILDGIQANPRNQQAFAGVVERALGITPDTTHTP